MASVNCRREAVGRAATHRFAALSRLRMLPAGPYGNPSSGPEVDAPKTWLHRWVNEKLYRHMERHTTIPAARLTPARKLWGRWLEFRLTDTPLDTLRVMKVVMLALWFGPAGSSDKWLANRPPDRHVE